jgi:ParB family chromosome partitioning protein
MTEVVQLPIKKVFSDPTFNCRGAIAPIDVVELARDIERNGLMQPIIVQPYQNGKYDYRIIAGHRRAKAHEVLKWEHIDCIVKTDIDEGKALISNLAENIHRKNLNILQEARALEKLKNKGFSIEAVAMALGKSTTWVRMRYELLELPEVIQEAAAAGYIKQNQIRDLFRIKDQDEQIRLARKIKSAKQKGDKVPHINKPKRNIFKAKQRNNREVEEMMNHVQKSIGNNFGTRCLAWAAGNISDIAIFQDIKQISEEAGLHYTIPDERTKL